MTDAAPHAEAEAPAPAQAEADVGAATGAMAGRRWSATAVDAITSQPRGVCKTIDLVAVFLRNSPLVVFGVILGVTFCQVINMSASGRWQLDLLIVNGLLAALVVIYAAVVSS